MPEKTRTTVVIESHEQTIIRRSRSTITSGEVRPIAEPDEIGQPLEPVIQGKRPSLGECLKTVAMTSVPLLRLLKVTENKPKTRQP